MGTRFPIDAIVLDRTGGMNLHRQIYSQLRGRLLQSNQTESSFPAPSSIVRAQLYNL